MLQFLYLPVHLTIIEEFQFGCQCFQLGLLLPAPIVATVLKNITPEKYGKEKVRK